MLVSSPFAGGIGLVPKTDRDPLVVLADDFTGAAEAAAYLGPGTAIRRRWDGAPREVILVAVRELAADDAAAQLTSLHLPDRLSIWFKMDSLGRGPYLAVLEYLANRFPDRIQLVCPAFPETGRTVEDGRIVRDGRPYRDLTAGTDGTLTSDTAASPGLTGLAGRRFVVNASTPHDLERLARLVVDPGILLAGSSGLLSHLHGPCGRPESGGRRGPVVVAVGSRTEETRRQVDALRMSPNPPAIVITPAEDRPLSEVRKELARNLAAALSPEATLVIVGGETARAVWEEFAWPDPISLGLLEPGIPVLGLPGTRYRVVTKSGSFGDERCLVRIATWAMGGMGV